ncbi:hypothetical protein BDY21DRAFT_408994 [Lineolata rhizophorae]|uniref:PH domain-containing protein n=1 Tax=Lineolata rhizophorae TaxID=578093 RepID=A0A6A6P6J4_9PEZI|nr:hypothetical protein BDY21DRAFT_408994 [Lineolata rhizophorae]
MSMNQHIYGSVPPPNPAQVNRGYGMSSAPDGQPSGTDFADTPGNPIDSSPLSQSLQQPNAMAHHGRFEEDFDASQRGSSLVADGDAAGLQRSASRASATSLGGATPKRSNTLTKKASVSRKSSLKRSGSRKSLRAGSIKGVSLSDGVSEDYNSVFYTPVPTSGSPTDILVSRFQAWRKLLKDLIAYFREVQASYEHRAKSLLKVSNVINNTNAPPLFLVEGGLNDANRILRDYHKQVVVESNKARDIESEVIAQLSGLRSDLGQKIKEIKSLSGDFKNSVDKEKESSRKSVAALEDALQAIDTDPTSVVGKGDPFVVRLGVDRQIERQIDEENYLHRAYLNLEGSGRELESIVVGEIQKAYNALATILKREADETLQTVDRLRNGPIAMSKDYEWSEFVEHDPHFVNPSAPLRRVEDIEYPGKHHPAAAEVRAGMLERKSKYLKSYTPGWYVLSPTHLHEFKSADRIYSQPPVMSLYLPEQKLGSHSQPGSSSHKFILKGRQTGSMHRGHSWVFRAESYDTMLAWYEDIKSLTEKTGEERNAYVRRHVRSASRGSQLSTASDEVGLENDEADEVPYSGNASLSQGAAGGQVQPQPYHEQRPSPGGRFPSDLQVNRHLQAPLSPSSGSSAAEVENVDRDLSTIAGGPQQNQAQHYDQNNHPPTSQYPPPPAANNTPYDYAGYQQPTHEPYDPYSQQHPVPPPHAYPGQSHYGAPAPPDALPSESSRAAPYPEEPLPQQQPQVYLSENSKPAEPDLVRHNSLYGDWMAPVAAGAAGGAAGATTAAASKSKEPQPTAEQPAAAPQAIVEQPHQQQPEAAPMPVPVPEASTSESAPTSTTAAALSPSAVQNEPAVGSTSVTSGPTSLGSDTPMSVPSLGGKDGDVLPKTVSRQNTDVSVSDLEVPGRYPKSIVQ